MGILGRVRFWGFDGDLKDYCGRWDFIELVCRKDGYIESGVCIDGIYEC